MLEVFSFQNLNIFVLFFSVSAMGILGFIIYFNNPQSITNKTFFALSLVTIFYTVVNYLSLQFQNPKLILWTLRIVIFLAVWHSMITLYLFYVFPKEKAQFPKIYKWGVFPIVIITSILTLTPFVFSGVNKISSVGQPKQAELGPLIALFGIVTLFLVVASTVLLFKKTFLSKGENKNQFVLILIGVLFTYGFIIIFNMIFPVFFDIIYFISLAPLFTLPFIILTAIAILKYKFLNIKATGIGLLLFALSITSLGEIIFAKNLFLIIYRSGIFIIILFFSVLILKSVLTEVRIKEKLQKLYGDLKLADEKLKKLDEEKSEFLSIASHQLRTPMTVIKGYISMIFEGSFGDFSGKLKEILNRIYISNERLVKLVDGLLDISRIERGKMTFSFKKQSFEKIIRDTVQELKPLAEQKEMKIIWEPENKNFPDVLIDENYMRQVILNLIDNAVKYSNKGIIAINLETKENDLLFSIKDNGIGISSDIMPFLFQRYSRGERVYTKAAEGMGLGLYIAKKIIEGHGGKIWAESEGEGKGATFFVKLRVVK